MTEPTINAIRFSLLAATIRAERGEWTAERAHALLTSHGHDVDENTAWGMLRYHAGSVLTQVGPGVFVLATDAVTRADTAEAALFGETW